MEGTFVLKIELRELRGSDHLADIVKEVAEKIRFDLDHDITAARVRDAAHNGDIVGSWEVQ